MVALKFFSPQAQEALDLAKRVVGDEGELTVGVLMAALLESAAGRDYLIGEGLLISEFERVGVVVRGEALPDVAEKREPDTSWRASPERAEVVKALSSYGRMLTEGDPPRKSVVEMDVEMRRLQKTLVKRKRCNLIVTGHPGTGKTALVYEFARRLLINDESIDPRLRDRDIFELSPSFLRAGAAVVGAYDERVSALIKTLEAHPKVIIFVDEVHSPLSSGMHERGPFTEANEAFKQALGKGTITMIGATTIAEYRYHIAPDEALERRFGLLKIGPPTRDGTISILEMRRPRLEAHYAPLRVPDAMLEKAVDLTDDHLVTRYQPDKAIQILDEACALMSIDNREAEELTETALVEALEDTIGHGLVRPETLTVEGVLAHLKEKIVGQDEALGKIAESCVAGLSADWGKKDKPQGFYFFCGPTGVGKTETALQLSKLLGAGREALLRIDCNTLAGGGIDAIGVIANQLLGGAPRLPRLLTGGVPGPQHRLHRLRPPHQGRHRDHPATATRRPTRQRRDAGFRLQLGSGDRRPPGGPVAAPVRGASPSSDPGAVLVQPVHEMTKLVLG